MKEDEMGGIYIAYI